MPPSSVHGIETDRLTGSQRAALRRLFSQAWSGGKFTEKDWNHALGGRHFIVEEAGEIVSHASVVERVLESGGHVLRTGYVEAVATHPAHRRQGLASSVMRAAARHIDARFALGALDTGQPHFYERLGWQVWRGPTFVRSEDGNNIRTAEEDGCVMVRFTATTPHVDLSAPISCDWRPGDVW